MTQAQKETLRFYTTNDYLLINGLLWGENEKTVDFFIRLINTDGRGVMEEAIAQGFETRWKCSREEGQRLFEIYQRRFPVIDSDAVKQRILEQARTDIANMMACLEPLETELVLYRNINTAFVDDLAEGAILKYLGFSSCSLEPHTAQDAMYGSGGCTLAEITAPAGTPAIRMDLLPEVQNEPDEVILAPVEFLVTKADKENSRLYLTCIKP